MRRQHPLSTDGEQVLDALAHLSDHGSRSSDDSSRRTASDYKRLKIRPVLPCGQGTNPFTASERYLRGSERLHRRAYYGTGRIRERVWEMGRRKMAFV